MIDSGDVSEKPGWIRISLHLTMTNDELDFIVNSLEQIIKHHKKWLQDYKINVATGDFDPLNASNNKIDLRKMVGLL